MLNRVAFLFAETYLGISTPAVNTTSAQIRQELMKGDET